MSELSEQQKYEIISEVDVLRTTAKYIETEINSLIERHKLYLDEPLNAAWNSARVLATALRTTSDKLKETGADSIKAYVTNWYRTLHYDMSDPLVEIAEEDVTDPEYEAVTFQGDNTWEVIISTPTHGRECVIVHSDGATWTQVYSADKI